MWKLLRLSRYIGKKIERKDQPCIPVYTYLYQEDTSFHENTGRFEEHP